MRLHHDIYIRQQNLVIVFSTKWFIVAFSTNLQQASPQLQILAYY